MRHPVLSFSCVLASILLCSPACRAAAKDESPDVVARWLAANAEANSLRVEFSQTKRLASLQNSIRHRGVLWLNRSEDQFRWQVGDPPETIVTRNGEELLIARPKDKKFERRPARGESSSGLAFLLRGFPRTQSEFDRRYRTLNVTKRDETWRIVTQPLDRGARGVRTFTFTIDAKSYRLRGLDLTLRDGSSQQILFTQVAVNPKLAPDLFEVDTTGYQATKF